MLRAARQAGAQVIWDLCHYGLPHDIDIWSPRLLDRFAAFCAATAWVVREEGDDVPFYCPVNEISFWAWAWAGGATMPGCTPLPWAAAGAAATVMRTVVWNLMLPVINLVGSVVVLASIDWRIGDTLVIVAGAATFVPHRLGLRGFPVHHACHREAAEVAGAPC